MAKADAMSTIKDIARIAGLNVSTVSRALNDSPLVQEATSRRVRRIAERVGNHKNEIARAW